MKRKPIEWGDFNKDIWIVYGLVHNSCNGLMEFSHNLCSLHPIHTRLVQFRRLASKTQFSHVVQNSINRRISSPTAPTFRCGACTYTISATYTCHNHINGTRGPSFARLSAVPPSAICGFVATPSSPTSHISTYNMVLQIISVAPAIRGQAVPSDGTNIPACLPKDFVRAENGFNSFVLPSCALQKGRQAAHLSSHTSAIWTFAT